MLHRFPDINISIIFDYLHFWLFAKMYHILTYTLNVNSCDSVTVEVFSYEEMQSGWKDLITIACDSAWPDVFIISERLL